MGTKNKGAGCGFPLPIFRFLEKATTNYTFLLIGHCPLFAAIQNKRKCIEYTL